MFWKANSLINNSFFKQLVYKQPVYKQRIYQQLIYKQLLLFTHFYFSLCVVLLIHTRCLLHDYTYLILFLSVSIYEFSYCNYNF